MEQRDDTLDSPVILEAPSPAPLASPARACLYKKVPLRPLLQSDRACAGVYGHELCSQGP